MRKQIIKTSIRSTVLLGSILIGFLLFLCSPTTLAANLKVDSSFSPEVLTKGLEIRAVAEQSDGKILIGGKFLRVNGTPRNALARLNADGSLDMAFHPIIGNTSPTVYSIIVQPDGKILIGGSFGSVNGTSRLCIARLNADGSLDSTFAPLSLFTSAGDIQAMALQPDGKIIVGGLFFYSLGGSPRQYIARINTDGTLDTTFDVGQGPDSLVNALAIQADGKILAGGYITSFGSVSRNGIARLNTNGSLDASFNPGSGTNSNVETIAIQSDNKILIGGGFTSYNGTASERVARINTDGSLDASFNNGGTINDSVRKVVVLESGKILIGGKFQFVGGAQRWRFARLNADGTLDKSFIPPLQSSSLGAVLVQMNGKIVLGGNFALLTRVNADASEDTSFAPRVEWQGGISAIAIQPDGKILIGGGFSRINGVARNNIARLNADGTLDTTFTASVNSTVEAIVVQPNGEIILGGSFTFINNSVLRNRIVRLSADGSTIDMNFVPSGANDAVLEITLQPDGKILVGGFFFTFNGALKRHIARLNSDGSFDAGFNAGTNDLAVTAITLQPDGKILVGGSFAFFNDTPRKSIARLESNGNLDSSFTAGADGGDVNKILPLPDGKILIGGSFSGVNNTTRQGVARLNPNGTLDTTLNTTFNFFSTIDDLLLQPDGKILVGGNFQGVNITSPRLNIARLNADGSSDSSFNVDASSRVSHLARQTDGKILIGGLFDRVNNAERLGLARLTQGNAVCDFDGDEKTDISIFRPSVGEWWYLKSSDGGNAAFQFGNSSDRIVPADYTGDGKTDVAIFRPSNGNWYILRSEDFSYYSYPFGIMGDLPAVGDFDADGKADSAVFRPSDTNWYIRRSSDGGFTIQQFGTSGDMPVAADYDNDGKTDIAIYRPSLGQWWINRSTAGVIAFTFGNTADKPVQGDYTGDGKADVAIWRPSTGEWFILRSEDYSYYSFPFGTKGDVPAPGDYDGDGRFDATVFRPAGATWYVQRSTAGTLIQGFGISGDKPVPNAFVP